MKAEIARQRRIHDFQLTFNTEPGKRVLQYLRKFFEVDMDCFVPDRNGSFSDSHKAAFRDGTKAYHREIEKHLAETFRGDDPNDQKQLPKVKK